MSGPQIHAASGGVTLLTPYKIAQDFFGAGPFLVVFVFGNRAGLAAQLEPEERVLQRIKARSHGGIDLRQAGAVRGRRGSLRYDRRCS